MNDFYSTPTDDQVPADVAVSTAGPLVLLVVDPDTAEQLAAGIQLAADLKARGAENRLRLVSEVEAIEQAAILARLNAGLRRVDAAIDALPSNVVPLIPLQCGA
ncbi:hypothetical protein P5P86_11915 [Nocardioides sp. BP30]|uniref:hypothetical protein n=1 Tax=Nocardioides sp. BP30 TaxID=3036374 RepID=UPI002469A579|nr:hypothetical protein [Nocardioides sp. BP30]WGL50670.1 hypothetical protein P5P86_11915 [Nocardioides sp. BP30]